MYYYIIKIIKYINRWLSFLMIILYLYNNVLSLNIFIW